MQTAGLSLPLPLLLLWLLLPLIHNEAKGDAAAAAPVSRQGQQRLGPRAPAGQQGRRAAGQRVSASVKDRPCRTASTAWAVCSNWVDREGALEWVGVFTFPVYGHERAFLRAQAI